MVEGQNRRADVDLSRDRTFKMGWELLIWYEFPNITEENGRITG
jgi:hypothetical protein